MSHEIFIDENNKAAIAFTGNRNQIWHGLGQELTVGAPLEVWQKEAGMDWLVKESPVTMQTIDNEGAIATKTFPNRKVLYRGDNQNPLSIVGEKFNIVQPNEVLEFFRDLTEQHGMHLSTAGCLFGGQRFWALAETGREGEVIKGDKMLGHLLFMTSVDGTMSSTAKFVSTRVVCNNTLTVALKEGGKNVVRKTHKSIWDNNQAKIDLGLLDASWENFMSDLRDLSEKKMSDEEVKKFFESAFFDPKREAANQGWGINRKIDNLMNLYKNGDGAEFDYGTSLGVLNAVTNFFTHGTGRRSADWAFTNAYYDSDNIKGQVFADLLAAC